MTLHEGAVFQQNRAVSHSKLALAAAEGFEAK